MKYVQLLSYIRQFYFIKPLIIPQSCYKIDSGPLHTYFIQRPLPLVIIWPSSSNLLIYFLIVWYDATPFSLSATSVKEDALCFIKSLIIACWIASLFVCLLAEGAIDYYIRTTNTYEWDTAAGELILAEAGGTTKSYPEGNPLLYNKEDLHNPWFEACSPAHHL